MEINKYIKLFANCIPVKGANRGLICDLQRNSYEFIPNELINLFDYNYSLDIDKTLSLFDDDNDKETILEYLSYLIDKEFAFYCSKEEINLFPSMNLDWDFPSQISNAIIDINKEQENQYYIDIFSQLTLLGCRYIQIRGLSKLPITSFEKIMEIINSTTIKAVDFVVNYHEGISIPYLIDFVNENRKIRTLILANYSEDTVIQYATSAFSAIMAVKEIISDEKHCGVIHPILFSINIETFTEGIKFNTCLNRKISIDKNGDIKNCPSMGKSFGNIRETSLHDAANNLEFKNLWSLNKDKVHVCNTCEFRYICTDCRAYLEDPNDINSKPLKCGYNPQINEWEDWSENPLKQQAIEYYKMENLKKTSKIW